MKVVYEVRYRQYWYDCHKVTSGESDEFDTLAEATTHADRIRFCLELYGVTDREDELAAFQKKHQLPAVDRFYGVFRVERVDDEQKGDQV
jgi:hypothetical protein